MPLEQQLPAPHHVNLLSVPLRTENLKEMYAGRKHEVTFRGIEF